MNDIKLIALDLDGTLLNSEGLISQRSIRAIQRVVKLGMQVIVASGRDYDALPVEQLCDVGILYAITSNGSAVYELKNRRCLFEDALDFQSVKDVLSYVLLQNAFVQVFMEGHAIAEKRQEEMIEYLQFPEHLKKAVHRNTCFYNDLVKEIEKQKKGIQKIAVVFPEKEKNRIQTVYRYLKENYDLHVVDGGCNNIEMNKSKVTKATGLEWFIKERNVTQQQVMAFGDSENDLEILQMVKYGFAMENAEEAIKQKCNYHTTTNNQDGVAAVLEKLNVKD